MTDNGNSRFEREHPVIFVVSGPSGGGKGTVCDILLEMLPDMHKSVSAATRAPRAGEVDGREYYFISRDEFLRMIDAGEVVEYTEYCGNFYGTPKKEIDDTLSSGRDLLLEIEVEGAGNIKRIYPDAVTLMLIPPTIGEMEHRLTERGSETPEKIKKRLDRAKEEIELAKNYDYVVVNEDGTPEECAKKLYNIITAERNRSCRMTKEIHNFLK